MRLSGSKLAVEYQSLYFPRYFSAQFNISSIYDPSCSGLHRWIELMMRTAALCDQNVLEESFRLSLSVSQFGKLSHVHFAKPRNADPGM